MDTRVARRALAEIPTGCSVFLDGDPLTVALAASIPVEEALTVVTNAIAIAVVLAHHHNIEVLLLGGWLHNATATTIQAGHAVAKVVVVDVAVLGAHGVSARRGLSSRRVHDADVKRTIVQRAARTIALVEHDAVGQDALVSFARLADVHTLIIGGVHAIADRHSVADLGARAVCV